METTIIAGNIGKDPELRRTQNGDPILGFSVAVDQGKDSQGNKRDAKWFDCSIWGKRAEALQPYLSKGMKVTVSGRISARENNGRAYLNLSVNELTMQGGGQPRTGGGYQDHAAAAQHMERSVMGDEILF